MKTFSLLKLLQSLLICLIHANETFSQSPLTPKDRYSIDCGATSSSMENGLSWQADTNSPYTSSGILASTDAEDSFLPSDAPFRTARIFPTDATYSFPVSPGRHWIRLYFYPFPFQNYTPASSIFSVTVAKYVLLSNLSVSKETISTNQTFLFKEYSLNVTSTSLAISFLPSRSPGSYAFINGLEIEAMPEGSFADDLLLVGHGALSEFGIPHLGLQTMHRVNVGGEMVSPGSDSGESRAWVPDTKFLLGAAAGAIPPFVFDITYTSTVPRYVAPPSVYGTARVMGVSNLVNPIFNLTWVFPVDLNFTYYVRLHFCETVYTSIYQRIFNIYINNQAAFIGLDILAKVASANMPYYVDFAVAMIEGDGVLKIQIGPTPKSGAQFNDAILNGVEILKMSNSEGSLGGLTLPPGFALGTPYPRGSNGKSSSKVIVIGASAAGAAAAFAGIAILGLCLLLGKKEEETKATAPTWLPLPEHGGNSGSLGSKASHKTATGSFVSNAPSSMGGRFFTFAEILEATNNFDESLILGIGGFGKVYKGELGNCTKVAVKRGNPRSEQGLTEFQTEIEMLSKLRHRHLVSLIGYCEEHSEMILVYDYMANGPLRGHLYGADLPPLTWKQRLEICIGAARGLHYLHTGAAQSIIHRDVKTTNILLDENFVAKVSDFGLSKTGPSLDRTHVSTVVKGSFGYLDPEYFRRQQLTEKSDVYSFGVVLMEILCARPAINPALPREQVNMADWAMHLQKMGMLDQIIDPKLDGQINKESLHQFVEIAEKCLAEHGIDRPNMGDVLWKLEYALQQQDNAMLSDSNGVILDDSKSNAVELPFHWHGIRDKSDTMITESHSASSEEYSEDGGASTVHSQLVHPDSSRKFT